MAAEKKALGKGLDALLGGNKSVTQTVASRPGVSEIEISKIVANPNQPRKTFDEAALQDLADSIKALGIIQPISLRESETVVGSYEIIAGERRFRASQIAGLTKIPAYIRKADDETTLIMALVENLQREGLDPIEIATTYQRLIEEGKLTQEEMGKKVGKNHATIANSLRLLKLPPEIQTGLINGVISEGHAKAILSLDDETKQRELYTEIVDKGLSVRAAEESARKMKDAKKPTRTSKSLEQKEMQAKLSEKLNSKVSISITGKGSGKISIAFKNEQGMKDIIALLEKIQ
ncbi:MAG: ParB/RepB/Spo0J family partition protein [Bacteroidales bacterium]|nr:ParB/RepB/Spo0J family partition protein [Bacteroidales bacterium]